MTSKVENVYQKHIYTQTDHRLSFGDSQTPSLFFYFNSHRMECTGLWDIKGSEGYIYPALKNWPDEGISGDISWGSCGLMDRESDL